MRRIRHQVRFYGIVPQIYMRNVALMKVNKTKEEVFLKGSELGRLEFLDTYEEFKDMVMNMSNKEKLVCISLPKEQTLENDFYFEYVNSKNIEFYLEKENDKTTCTFNKKLKKRLK